MALPQAFEQRMKRLLGEEFSAFSQALERPQARGLRVNLLKTSPEAFVQNSPFTLQPIPWVPEGFFYQEDERPGKHPYYEAGAYYIQEPSAMAVGTLAQVQPHDIVLDLCAAPGGKTSHLASHMAGKGVLIANEIHPARSAILAQTVERMGIWNSIVLNETPERLAQRFPSAFDVIVVDAPCSGEGMFRKDGNPAQDEWTPELPAFCAQRQAEILDQAAQMLKAGGRLVYSTCTFAPEENEGTLSRFLERHPEFEMADIDPMPEQFSSARPDWTENGNPTVAKAVRLFPHKLNGEGHFAAVLKKIDGEQQELPKTIAKTAKKGKKIQPEPDTSSLNEVFRQLPENGIVSVRKENVFLVPQNVELSGLRVKSYGVQLGTLRKNRFEPAHAAAHAFPLDCFVHVCDLPADSEEIQKYLRGETFAYDGEKGWTVVCADGYALGWGKASGGIMKNHYPKGLRWT